MHTIGEEKQGKIVSEKFRESLNFKDTGTNYEEAIFDFRDFRGHLIGCLGCLAGQRDILRSRTGRARGRRAEQLYSRAGGRGLARRSSL